MTDIDTEDRGRSSAAVFAIFIVSLPLLVFAPLILSFIEHYTMGSGHVEQFCHDIGIHGFLTKIYRPVIDFFETLF